MEPRFGHDFSDVRVHTNALATESARSVNALAYTVGRDVVFGTGKYAPETAEGRRLVAHELTHVLQQNQGLNLGLQRQSPEEIEAGDLAEQEATEMETEMETAIEEVAGNPKPNRNMFQKTWGKEIENLKRIFAEKSYGCWCGPGSKCDNGGDPGCVCCGAGDYSCCSYAEDGVDECCCIHDKDWPSDVYSVTPEPSKVSMWSIEGFEKTLYADERFVKCLRGLGSNERIRRSPSAQLYRSFATAIFGTRLAIETWIRLNRLVPRVIRRK